MKFNYENLKSFSFKTLSLSGEYTEFFMIDENLVKVLTTGVGLMPLPVEYTPDLFRKKIKSFKIDKWKERYELLPNKIVEDGEQWEVELAFEDGKILKSSGNNAYPKNWNEVEKMVNRFHCDWIFEIENNDIDVFDFTLIEENGKYKEQITIDRVKEEFVLEITDLKQQCVSKMSVCDIEDIDDLLDDMEKVEAPIETDEKIKKKEPNYTLRVVSGKNELFYKGNFIKSELPKNWYSISRLIKEFINEHNNFNQFKISSIKECLERDEIIYLSVLFDYGEKSYYYKTKDTTIEIGDYVRVPVGKDNHEEIVFVDNIEVYNIDNVPLSLDKTKWIIGKVED